MLFGVLKECFFLLNKMSVYLLFGFLVAGVIHVFLKEDFIVKHLGKHNFISVVKASLFGIPLPLCSCSVIPTALSLKRDGASQGSILSFLISTPTTGIDSIFATYSLMGGVFTGFRILASFISALIAGFLAIFFNENKPDYQEKQQNEPKTCCQDCATLSKENTFKGKLSSVFQYAFVDLMKEAGGWIILGIFLGGVISYFIPEAFIEKYLGSLWQSIIVMMIVGIPMYVCSAGSLPIAAALMLKGLNPAAAFVFLFVGPATNSAALTVILKELGLKSVIIFLGSIIATSVTMGILLNYLWVYLDIDLITHLSSQSTIIPLWVEITSSIILSLIILWNLWKTRF